MKSEGWSGASGEREAPAAIDYFMRTSFFTSANVPAVMRYK
jgi:hypothetical protein